MRTKLIAIALLLVGPIVAYTSYTRKTELEKIARDGEIVPGIIEGGETRSRKGSKTYTFEVSFTTKAGAKLRQSFTGHGDFVGLHLKDNTIYNERVQVQYLAADPSKAELVGNFDDPTIPMYVGIGLFPVGLIVAYFVFLRKKAEPAAAEPAATTAT